MRKFLNLCLSLILILSCFPAAVSAAGEPDIKWLAKAENASQAESLFKDDNGYITTHSGNDNELQTGGSYAGLKVTKLSSVAVRWANPLLNHQWSFQLPVTGDTTGYSYINFWFYAKGDFSARMYQVFAGIDDMLYFNAIGFKRGWNLVSMPILNTTANLTALRFTSRSSLSAIIPEGLPNAGSPFGSQPITYDGWPVYRHYMDSVWLSKTPAVNTFGDMNVKNNANLVLTNIGTINIKAPGIVPGSVSSEKISISYCVEGTHDENNHSSATLIAGTDFNLSSETDVLKINFTNELNPGTTYTIKITGATHSDNFKWSSGYVASGTTYLQTAGDILGSNEMPFGSYSLTFRTKGEDENFPPQAQIISPESNERFYPDDSVSIKAVASDADGTVEKVEFYADETKIGEDLVPSDGVYEFLWENVPEKMSGYEIKAVATDDKGVETESTPLKIFVIGVYLPKVELENPAEDITIVRNYSGITSSTDVEVTAKATCYGATPAKVEFMLDGEIKHTITSDASGTYTYTYTNLPIGTHSICVEVTDSEGNVGNSATRYITCTDYGKKTPALAEYNFEDKEAGSELDWTKEGTTGKFTVETEEKNNVAKIETANPAASETVSIQKRYRTSLSASPWEITAKIMPMDTEHERTYTISGTAEGTLVTFAKGGDIMVANSKVGSYNAGEWTEIRFIVNPAIQTSYCLVNDVPAQTKTGLAAAFSSNGATIKLSQKGISGKTGICLLDDVGVYKIDKTNLEAEGIKVCDSAGADLGTASVPLDASYISVLLNEDLNNESIKNNIQVIDTSTDRKISLKYSGGKAYFNEVLKSDTTYNVVLTTSVSSQSGTSLAKNVSYSFTTASGDVGISDESFSASELSAGVTSVTFSFDASNNTIDAKDIYAVAVVYEGGKQAGISVKKINLSSSTVGNASVTVPVTYTDNTFIEVYIVCDLQTLKPVVNTIYKLN